VQLENDAYKELLAPDFDNKTTKIVFGEIETSMQKWLLKMETAGFSLSKIQLINYTAQKDSLVADL
jgi:hypothetical protein